MGTKRRSKGTAVARDGRFYAVNTLADRTRHWTRVPDDGQPLDLADAREFARQLQKRIDAGWDPRAPAPAAPADVTALAHCRAFLAGQRYDSAPKDRDTLDRYFARSPVAAVPLRAFTKAHARQFVRWLAAQPSARGGTLAPRTVRNAYDAVRRAFQAAADDDAVPLNVIEAARRELPALADKDPTARDGWEFGWAEVALLVHAPAVPPDRRVLNALRFGTGARISELAVLRVRDWDRAVGPLTRLNVTRARASVSRRIGGTKTLARKPCPVHPALEAVLAAWLDGGGWARHYGRAPTPEDFLVPTRTLSPRHESKANEQFKDDCVAVRIRPRHQHAARHAFISRIQDDGADGSVVRWITHAPPKSAFDGYTRGQWGRLCAEVAKLRFPAAQSAGVDASVDVPPENSAIQQSGREDLKLGAAVTIRQEQATSGPTTPAESAPSDPLALTASTPADPLVQLLGTASALWQWGDRALLEALDRER